MGLFEQLKLFWSGLTVQWKVILVLGVFGNIIFFGYFSGFGSYLYFPLQAPMYPYGGDGSAGTEGKATYRWEGTIKVKNSYNGEAGRHLWRGEYRVKFLEVPTTSSRGGRAIGQSFQINDFVPLELDYTIHADQNWDRGTYSIQRNAAGEIIYGDVTYSGVANGRVTREDGLNVNDLRYLLGDMNRLDAPHSRPFNSRNQFSSYEEYLEYLNNVFSPPEQGWYDISIGFIGWAQNGETSADTARRQRDMYKGIERGGKQPPFFDDPNADFLHWIPPYMPDGMHALGRLDRPDQREVSGSYSFPTQGAGSSEDRDVIEIEWHFTRIPLSEEGTGGAGVPDSKQEGVVGPLGGRVTMTYDYSASRRAACIGRLEVKTRFPLKPVISENAPGIVLTYRADEMTYDIRTDGCPDAPGDNLIYDFPKGFHLSGSLPLTEQNLGYALFFPTHPQFSMQLPHELTDPGGASKMKGSYTTLTGGGPWPAETNVVFKALEIVSDSSHCANPNSPLFARPDNLEFCTEPTPCSEGVGAPIDCFTNPQRYYIIPFQRSFTWDAPDDEPGINYHIGDVNVKVEICDACGDEFLE